MYKIYQTDNKSCFFAASFSYEISLLCLLAIMDVKDIDPKIKKLLRTRFLLKTIKTVDKLELFKPSEKIIQ